MPPKRGTNGRFKKGKGFWKDFSKGFVDGFTLPLKGLNALGIKPSQIAGELGAPPLVSSGLKLIGQGKKKRKRRVVGAGMKKVVGA